VFENVTSFDAFNHKLVVDIVKELERVFHFRSDQVDVSKREKEYLVERQELAIDFIFCLVLIEVLTKLSVHPVPESFIHTIEDYAFRHFKQQETLKDRSA